MWNTYAFLNTIRPHLLQSASSKILWIPAAIAQSLVAVCSRLHFALE